MMLRTPASRTLGLHAWIARVTIVAVIEVEVSTMLEVIIMYQGTVLASLMRGERTYRRIELDGDSSFGSEAHYSEPKIL